MVCLQEKKQSKVQEATLSYLGPVCATYLHNLGVCTGRGTLRFADEVRLCQCAAETFVPLPQAPIAVRRSKTHTVTLFTGEVSGRGGRENNKLTPSPSSTAAVLKTSRIVQTCRGEKRFVTQSIQHIMIFGLESHFNQCQTLSVQYSRKDQKRSAYEHFV